MTNVVDTSTLVWVKREVDAALQEARQALNDYAEDPQERAPLGYCATYIHQVRGVLTLLELEGPEWLTGEMEAVVEWLRSAESPDPERAVEPLLRVLMQLPDYLESLQEGAPDRPLVLLPLLNELRRARGEPPLDEIELFHPDLSVMPPPAAGGAAGDVREVVRGLRPRYQAALLNVIRGSEVAAALKVLASLVERLDAYCKRPETRQWLWAVAGMVEALRDGGLPLDAGIKRTLGQVDQALRELVRAGEDGLAPEWLRGQVRQALFAVARASSRGPAVRVLKTAFGLDELVPEERVLAEQREALHGFNAALKQTVAKDIVAELGEAKDTLDIFVRGSDHPLQPLHTVAERLQRVADTLGLLQLPDARARLGEQVEALEAVLAEHRPPDTAETMAIAAAVLSVESQLGDWGEVALPEERSGAAAEAAGTAAGPHDHSDYRRTLQQVMEETRGELAVVEEAITECLEGGAAEGLDAVPAAFHRIVGALDVAGYDRVAAIVRACARAVRELVIEAPRPPAETALEPLADAMASVEYFLDAFATDRVRVGEVLDSAEAAVARLGYPVDALPDPGEGAAVAVEPAAPEEAAVPPPAEPVPEPAAAGEEDELVAVFLEEAEEELEAIRTRLAAWRADTADEEALRELRRSFHTLKGSGRLVGASELGEFAWAFEDLLNRVIDQAIAPGAAVFACLEECEATLPELLGRVRRGEPLGDAAEALRQRAHAVARGGALPDAAPEPATEAGAEAPLEEAPEAGPEEAPAQVGAGEASEGPAEEGPEEVPREASEEAAEEGPEDVLEGGAEGGPGEVGGGAAEGVPEEASEAASGPVAGIPYALEAEGYLAALDEVIADQHQRAGEQPAVGQTLLGPIEGLNEVAEAAIADAGTRSDHGGRWAEVAEITAGLAAGMRGLAAEGRPLPEDGLGLLIRMVAAIRDRLGPGTGPAPVAEASGQAATAPAAEAFARAAVSPAGPPRTEQPPAEEVEDELLRIFLEEGVEILDAVETEVEGWQADPEDNGYLEQLQRHLHTLKGSARVAGLAEVADLAHRVETLLNRVVDGHVLVGQEVFAVLQGAQDRLSAMLAAIRAGEPVPSTAHIDRRLDELLGEGGEAATGAAEPAAPAAAVESVGGPDEDRRQAGRVQGEKLRVDAGLLDDLVNYAGEVSIYRGRMEREVGVIHANLGELEQTVERLQQQLRQFEIENEAQIQSRFRAAEADDEGFDPLEMDRFTNIQQISRSMMESLGDLTSIDDTLRDLARGTEDLLAQQGRVNTELQEGLMQTRMMPLVEYAPRLRRLVRQVSAELGRKAELRFEGAEVEMDRHVVERMLAPTEHLLRNAVAHGIEDPAARREAGKPETGRIVIALAREGGETVIRVRDDGRGIDLERLQRTAIERGLLEPDADLGDEALAHFILESGLSTAEEVTQLSGRGVGMDVVNSEVRQLGGSLDIETVAGAGTTFTLRLPVTLALSRALLVRAGEETVAVPLLGVQGVVRSSEENLSELASRPPYAYRWMEEDYRLLHLGTVLGTGEGPPLGAQAQRALLLARSGEQRVALLVDGLIGSREVVIKSLGPVLSTLTGLSGATITGDGSVVLILDLPNLIRHALARRPEEVAAPLPLAGREEVEAPTVLVVDDSVTVRRVTARLLGRNHMRVELAKDGVEAVARMEEHTPDVVLLDIEMPRMDGYELATHIRNHERLHDVPIVMITSRTGEKHRARAQELGVDSYLGKPYTEDELLERVRAMLTAGRHSAVAQEG